MKVSINDVKTFARFNAELRLVLGIGDVVMHIECPLPELLLAKYCGAINFLDHPW